MSGVVKPKVTATGIPASISRDDYLNLIRSLGIDPDVLRSLEFRWDCIVAELPAYDPDGNRVIDDNVLTCHEIVIPVLD